jgi:hypothetical protein
MASSPSSLSRNYLLTMLRGFLKNKVYTSLNLAGLALGFAVFMFSMIYVTFSPPLRVFFPQPPSYKY